ncbi:MAG: LytTR family DNA-binding domain-containing protein [Burkholderiales bacterium]|jgi:two-component system response regulator AlgR|nr:LytTR family DNA-binding domain-containing protein [Burkholderiales bacterium]
MNETTTAHVLRVLIVDDEALARRRLRDLLDDSQKVFPVRVVGEVETGVEALNWVQNSEVDLLLLDIHMPDMDGLELASHLLKMKSPPRVIFVTAYNEHALRAFELNAVDYLMKPVRIDRLIAALRKVPSLAPISETQLNRLAAGARRYLPVIERSKIELVPIEDIYYFKAELKYVTAKALKREYILEDPLTKLEEEYKNEFLRIHRSYLVARHAVQSFVRGESEEGESVGWQVVLKDLPEKLPVSRRQRGVLDEFIKNA